MTLTTFAEVQFPTKISAGAKGGPAFSTNIIELASGAEQRVVNWSRERPKYDVSTGLRDAADFNAYQKFFYARQGKAQGFRFKDWADYRCPYWRTTPGDMDTVQTLFTTTGALATFQLTKTYGDAGNTFSRQIKKPVSGTVTLYNAGVAMTAGAGGTQYQVDYTTGIVTLGATVAATTGHAITGSFEFDVPARFDTDELNATLQGNAVVIWDSIPVVGLKL